MMEKSFIIVPFLFVTLLSLWMYGNADAHTEYFGLAVVPCIDREAPLKQDFETTLKITVDGENYPIPEGIGHDRGKCMRAIHTDDASGKIRVQLNDDSQVTLGDFFKTWKHEFSSQQVVGKKADATHAIKVFVNGQEVSTFETTFLQPNQILEVRYGE
jgi:hypothetical protein